jgi:4-hydroxybenzoate polyprenyltransferase
MKTAILFLKSMRPKQWVKNVFVLAPLFFDRKLFDLQYLWSATLGFLVFCLASGFVYVLNDIVDEKDDARNPRKAHRPIASGALKWQTAAGLSVLVGTGAFVLSRIVNEQFSYILGWYIAMQLAYTMSLKHKPIVDVLSITTGFVLRVVAGMFAVNAESMSLWLILCVFFLALFLGFGKRYAESINGNAQSARDKNYNNHEFTGQLLNISATLCIAMYSLYTITATNMRSNHLAATTIVFVVYGIFRYLYLVHIEKMQLAPDEALLKDRALQVDIALWGVAMFGVMYL